MPYGWLFFTSFLIPDPLDNIGIKPIAPIDQGSVLIGIRVETIAHNQKLIRSSYYKGSYFRSLADYILYCPIARVNNFI